MNTMKMLRSIKVIPFPKETAEKIERGYRENPLERITQISVTEFQVEDF